MTIKRTALLINSLTICVIILAAISLWFLSKKTVEVEEMASNRFYSNLLVDELRKSSEELTRQVRIYAASGRESAEKAYHMVLAVRNGDEPRPANAYIAPGQRHVLLDLLKEYGITDEEYKLVVEANGLSDDLVALEVQAMNAVKGVFMDARGNYTITAAPDRELAIRLVFSDDYQNEVRKIMAPMNEFQDRVHKRTDNAIELAARHLDTAQALSNFSLVMVFLIALFNLLFNHFGVIRPLLAVTDSLKSIVADGKTDLSKKLEVQNKNEIGNLALFFNMLLENLMVSISKTKITVDNLAMVSEELSSVSHLLESGSEATVNQSVGVSSATEQMTVNINAMAGGAEEASANANEVAGAAEQMSVNMSTIAAAIKEMGASISQIAGNAGDASKVAGEATKKAQNATAVMSTLGVAAKEIGQVTDVIKKIADKTNLLALNATIEAASAGEAGKGFAVVAGEIKELANQSAASADDITHRIESIQDGTNNAVNVIQDVSDIIIKINQSVEAIVGHVDQQTKASGEMADNIAQASAGAKRVAGAIGEVARGANDVSRNAGEAARGANDVSKSVAVMNQVAEESAKGAAQVNNSAKELQKMSTDLKEAIGIFRT